MRTRGHKPGALPDLFDEIPVTWHEVYQRMFAVTRIPQDSWRLRYYLEYCPEAGEAQSREAHEYSQ